MPALSRRAVLAGVAATARPDRVEAERPGRLIRTGAFASRHVAPRTVAVRLPDGAERERRHVLYVPDEQKLSGATEAPGGGSWNVDRHPGRPIGRGAAPPAIVMAVWNTPARLAAPARKAWGFDHPAVPKDDPKRSHGTCAVRRILCRSMPFGEQSRSDPTAFVAPGAQIIGDVEIGAGSSIWHNCVLRGDMHRIRVGRGTNLQDGTVVHVDSGVRRAMKATPR